MAKYPNPTGWIAPRCKGYKMMCCDCGLVHRLYFRLVDIIGAGKKMGHKIEMRVERDNRATGQARRWKKK